MQVIHSFDSSMSFNCFFCQMLSWPLWGRCRPEVTSLNESPTAVSYVFCWHLTSVSNSLGVMRDFALDHCNCRIIWGVSWCNKPEMTYRKIEHLWFLVVINLCPPFIPRTVRKLSMIFGRLSTVETWMTPTFDSLTPTSYRWNLSSIPLTVYEYLVVLNPPNSCFMWLEASDDIT